MGSSLCTITFLPAFLYFHCSVIINKVPGYRNVKGNNSACENAPNALLKGPCHEIFDLYFFAEKTLSRSFQKNAFGKNFNFREDI